MKFFAPTPYFFDLGSETGIMYSKEQGVISQRPTSILFHRELHRFIDSTADRLWQAEEHTPMVSISAIEKGVVADEDALVFFLEQCRQDLHLPLVCEVIRPLCVCTVPASIDPLHVMVTKRAFAKTGFGSVLLLSTPVCIYAGMRAQKTCALIVDIGAGKTEVTTIQNGEILHTKLLPIGSFWLAQHLHYIMEEQHALTISWNESMSILLQLDFLKKTQVYTLSGKDAGTGRPTTIRIARDDIDTLLNRFFSLLLAQINDVCSQTEEQVDRIFCTGGLMEISGFSTKIGELTGFPVEVAARGKLAPILGAIQLYHHKVK
ncbi:hypothetical protein C5B42_03640 [Candidatus Cerribacteria bacterium 'Amazon FNV 2010 28 9']|uniref:Uncharacterized protein n=1 Tax=Candidatus Cerribacteria bacterium 'Amazon FNV 2010 28 9' TaxID=2081795 RepID=A0A317JSH5_9BACT|nr:MAG: hypothetical protein C5B42_03640 [Candidatus Cerribacteria bacterium 'Amazon FNV 2010 28 9']